MHAFLAACHGALTIGLTTYPALESHFTLANDLIPSVTLDLTAKTPVNKAEPVTLQAGIHLTLWKF